MILIKNVVFICININDGCKLDQVKQALLGKEDIPTSFYLKVEVAWPIQQINDFPGGGVCYKLWYKTFIII